jgi:hypothetical protein
MSSAVAGLFNVTIAGNQADADFNGTGIGGGVVITGNATLNFKNTIIAGNFETTVLLGSRLPVIGDCAGTLTSLGFNLLQNFNTTHCTVNGGAGSYLLADPALGPLQANGGPTWTQAPTAGSPAIDAGELPRCDDGTGVAITVDQRGVPRPQPAGGRCDIGAYEYGATPTVAALSPNPVTPGGPAFQLTVTGTGFISGTTVLWDGQVRPTRFVTPTVLMAAIPASDIASPGIVPVTAKNPGPGDGAATPSLSLAIQGSQTISFGPLPDRLVSDQPFTVSATASSGLPVAFSASGTCSVAGNMVTLTGEGSCTITASQAGDATYDPAAPVGQTFTVRPVTVYLPGVLNGRGIG